MLPGYNNPYQENGSNPYSQSAGNPYAQNSSGFPSNQMTDNAMPPQAMGESTTPRGMPMNSMPVSEAGTIPQAQPMDPSVLPTAVPEAQIISQYQAMGIDVSKYSSDPEYTSPPTAEAIPPQGTFFTATEIQTLQGQPIPVAVDFGKVQDAYAAPPPPSQNIAPQIVLQPTAAMPVMIHAFSKAYVKRDSTHKGGIKSCDPILDNEDEIIKFFNYYNTRPIMFITVEGYHHETRHTTHQENGKTVSRTETVRRTDFKYNVDITNFIFPYGKITVSAGSSKDIQEMIKDYLGNTNKLKSLQMVKKVFWDYRSLCYLVRCYIRQLGWNRELSVHSTITDASVRLCTESKMASAYDNCCCRCMMITTIIPAIVFAIYGSGNRERGMRSIFSITLSPLMVFDYIRPQLWCTGFRVCSIQ